MDVISILNSKNRALRRFLKISLEFVEKSKQGDLSDLSSLLEKRDASIRGFGLYDKKIEESVRSLCEESKTDEFRQKIKAVLDEKSRLLQEILKADARLVQWIEDGLMDLTKEMTASQKSKEVLQKFKSKWLVESGEELDKTL